MQTVELSHNGNVYVAGIGSNKALMRSEAPTESVAEATVNSQGEEMLSLVPQQPEPLAQETGHVAAGQELDKVALHQDGVVPPASIAESEEEILPAFGMSNVADIAYKAMDLLYGTTGIIPEDYPFACICNDQGMCDGDAMGTSCKGRPGTWSAARSRTAAAPLAALMSALALAVTLTARTA